MVPPFTAWLGTLFLCCFSGCSLWASEFRRAARFPRELWRKLPGCDEAVNAVNTSMGGSDSPCGEIGLDSAWRQL